MDDIARVVIVGAGQAGALAAATLRQLGYRGALTLIGQEPHPPYERPPLSKAVLLGDEAVDAQTAIHPPAFYEEQDITLLTGAAVVALDTDDGTLRLDDGRVIPYDRCLLATGGAARELPGLPRGTPGVHYIRTLDDARALRRALLPGTRLGVIGGGFLGLEIASTAAGMGATATVVEGGPRLLQRALPEALSHWLAQRAQAQGVRLHLGAAVVATQAPSPGQPACITLADGNAIEADLLAVSIGLTPATALAAQAGLLLDPANGGIAVDAQCRSSDSHVYAAGDCTSQHQIFLGMAARLESWQNACEQARTAAAGMLGLDLPAPAYPWFWTDQFGCNVQILGTPAAGLEYACRGAADPTADAPRGLWLGHRDGVPVHGIAVNAGTDLRQLRVLFERGLPLDTAAFADPAVPLKPLVKASQQAATLAR